MFREQVSWIDCSVYLAEVNSSGPYGLLDPESVRVQMAQFTEALSTAYANCRTGVCPHTGWYLHAEISE